MRSKRHHILKFTLSFLPLFLLSISTKGSCQTTQVIKDSVKVTPQYTTCFGLPRVLNAPSLSYPKSAKKAGIEGRVIIQMLVEKNGSVMQSRVAVSSGNAALDSAANHASRKFLFAQTKSPQWVSMPIAFKLDEADSDTGYYVLRDGLVGNLSGPKIIKGAELEYPDSAKIAGLEGHVRISVLLDIDGHIMQVRVGKTSGIAILDSAAVRTARKYIFTPAMEGGRRVRIWYSLPFEFRLQSKAKRTR